MFAALADPTRRRILESLSGRGERQVTELARPFRMSLPAISRHLRVLESAKLIQRQRRGRIHLIRSNPAGIKDAQQWMMQCVAAIEFSFDKLDVFLKSEERKEKKP